MQMVETDRRSWGRFTVKVENLDSCLVLDGHGNGYESRIHNISVGGLCLELVAHAAGTHGTPLPEFDRDNEFEFSCNIIEKWGLHLQGRMARVTWREGNMYGLRFEAPLGRSDETLYAKLAPLVDLRRRLWKDGKSSVPFLKRISLGMSDLLDDSADSKSDPATRMLGAPRRKRD